MKFAELSKYLSRLEATSSRNEITMILAGLFKTAGKAEIDKICYLALGELMPAYKGLEFNLAEKMLIQIIAAAYGIPAGRVAQLYKSKGDLGDVAYENAKRKVQISKLSVNEVYEKLLEIAKESGAGSQKRKIKKAAGLLSSLDPLSAKFITRIPVGKLRLGFSGATILDALSIMAKGDKTARPAIERAYNVNADIGAIAAEVKSFGIESLKKLTAKTGLPVRPALAERVPDTEEIIKKLGPTVAVEPKLDGFRTQIHVWPARAGGKERPEKHVVLFSRNLENTTPMFPEIVAAAKKLTVSSVILDGETIGYDPKTGKFMPFQETVQRKRKYDIVEMAKKIPLATWIFDILYFDGRSLLGVPFSERRKLLEKVMQNQKAALHLVTQTITDDPKVIVSELNKMIKAGLEGVVIKNLGSHYEAGSRGFHWVKFKPGTAALGKIRGGGKAGLLDTIDCIVMGAYKGRGMRAKLGIGGVLLGIRGKNNRYYSISRLGSGLSEEQFLETAERIQKLKVSEKPGDYVTEREVTPDIWAKPKLVMEILADEITLSPRHTAGKINERGYSLRFPRLVRFRDDKNPEDATTVGEVEKMYKAQKR